MEIRQYYQKIRQAESGISEPYVVVISLETADGGVAGTATEVNRANAARLIVDGRARLADPDEAKDYHARCEQARKAAEQKAAAAKMQVTLISDADLRALKSGRK
ncbi:MAG TPA: hypothetical protein VFL57_02630 [Bryobacteraceae bacterium]|nr:hypothetical protein [Bryobacteraceae bacterium]